MTKSFICKIPDCGKPSRARGWCKTHYQQWRRQGDPLTYKINSAGVNNGRAKLTESDIIAIRADNRRQKEIAADYGIHRSNVRCIKKSISWAHIK